MAGESYQLLKPEGFIEYEQSKCNLFQACDMVGNAVYMQSWGYLKEKKR